MVVLFGLFATWSARLGRHRTRFLGSLSGLLPSLVPIAFGYLFAHNVEFLLINSQLMAPLIGNPVGKESWPLSLPYPFNDSYEVHTRFLPSSFYWYAAVVVIIAVHVIAVVLAHRYLQRRAAARDRELVSELPWLVVMVGYTMLSLWLLAQPLVEQTASTSG
jgi:protein-S-isoprenylcysteine O-methyltransferase Ste14